MTKPTQVHELRGLNGGLAFLCRAWEGRRPACSFSPLRAPVSAPVRDIPEHPWEHHKLLGNKHKISNEHNSELIQISFDFQNVGIV